MSKDPTQDQANHQRPSPLTGASSPGLPQLSAWTAEANEYMDESGRKMFPADLQSELYSRGARRCTRCTQVKVLADFTYSAQMKDGYNSRCRDCTRAGCSSSHETYRSSRLAYKRQYREENLELETERGRRYRAENLEDLREYDRAYYLEHPWAMALRNGYYRAAKAGNEAVWITEPELLGYWESEGINPDECFYSGHPIIHGETRSLDHLVAISEGGGHTLANLRPAHISMNVSKNKKRAVEWVVSTQPGTKTKEMTV